MERHQKDESFECTIYSVHKVPVVSYGKELKQFSCKICSKRFKTNFKLRCHNEMIHEGPGNCSRGLVGWNLLHCIHQSGMKMQTYKFIEK